MGALLTVHETIAIDKQKQCSTQYRALLYYGKNNNSSNDIADGTIPSAVRPQRGHTMVTAGLDLRGKAPTWLRPQRGRTTRITVLLCDIFEVVPCIVTSTAGQDPRLP